VHEACHTAFDDTLNRAADWEDAQKADTGTFISTYARDYPQREDVAESFLCYLAVRYRSDRISDADGKKILEAIPERIAYFDAQPLTQSIHPTVQRQAADGRSSHRGAKRRVLVLEQRRQG
jgi:hypothetical protein